ncbi:hypothetical protein GmHk_06G015597 [Glycine max]|nr:hypothetical protein GmHk_06G015597 [Glycine max]
MATAARLDIGWDRAGVTLGMVVGGGQRSELDSFHLFLRRKLELALQWRRCRSLIGGNRTSSTGGMAVPPTKASDLGPSLVSGMPFMPRHAAKVYTGFGRTKFEGQKFWKC